MLRKKSSLLATTALVSTFIGTSTMPAFGFTAPNNQYQYQPGSDPCTNTSVTSNAAQAITNSLNYALQEIPPTKSAKGRSSENTINVPNISWSFTMPSFKVPQFNGWFYTYGGGTYGGKTYSNSAGGSSYTASASSAPKISGLNTATANVSISQSDCSYQAGKGYTSSGELTSTIAWPSLQVELSVNVDGYLVDYGSGTPVKATISNMKVQAPGKYTFASNNPQTAELSYLQFIQCTSSGQVENVQVLGSSDSQLASHVTNNIQKGVNGVASKLCKYINSKLIKKVPIEINI